MRERERDKRHAEREREQWVYFRCAILLVLKPKPCPQIFSLIVRYRLCLRLATYVNIEYVEM